MNTRRLPASCAHDRSLAGNAEVAELPLQLLQVFGYEAGDSALFAFASKLDIHRMEDGVFKKLSTAKILKMKESEQGNIEAREILHCSACLAAGSVQRPGECPGHDSVSQVMPETYIFDRW